MNLLAKLNHETNYQPLYPYQRDAVEALRAGFVAGHRCQMLYAPTGSGKTRMAVEMIYSAISKGSKCAFLADRVALVDQTSMRLFEAGIPHGVVMGSRSFGRGEIVQVCSMQTLERRGYLPKLEFMIVDEAHTMRRKIIDCIKNADIPVIGLSATPFTAGLNEVYSNVVNATTTNELLRAVDENTGRTYLAPLKVFNGTPIDMTDAKLNSRGEWADKEIEKRARPLIGDAVREYIKHTNREFGGPVKTLVFSSTIEHGRQLMIEFQREGLDFRQYSYRSSGNQNKAVVEMLRKGEIMGAISVDALVKGLDIPDIRCIVDMRPYRKSLTGEIQKIGRGMRSAPGKEYCLLLDHCENFIGFQDEITAIFARGCSRLPDRNYRQKVRRKRKMSDSGCKSCGFVMPPMTKQCPACGTERISHKKNRTMQVEGRMEYVVMVDGSSIMCSTRDVWQQLLWLGWTKHFDEERAKRFAYAQYRTIFKEWPPKSFGTQISEVRIPRNLRALVKKQIRDYYRNKH